MGHIGLEMIQQNQSTERGNICLLKATEVNLERPRRRRQRKQFLFWVSNSCGVPVLLNQFKVFPPDGIQKEKQHPTTSSAL